MRENRRKRSKSKAVLLFFTILHLLLACCQLNLMFIFLTRMATKLLRLVHDKKKEAVQGGTFCVLVQFSIRKEFNRNQECHTLRLFKLAENVRYSHYQELNGRVCHQLVFIIKKYFQFFQIIVLTMGLINKISKSINLYIP